MELHSNTQIKNYEPAISVNDAPTVSGGGVYLYTLYLFATVLASGIVAAYYFVNLPMQTTGVITVVAFIAALVLSLSSAFLARYAKYLSFAFAFAEGVGISGITYITLISSDSKVITNAIFATIATFFACYIMYSQKIVKVDGKFRKFVGIALIVIISMYLIQMLLAFVTGIHLNIQNNLLVNLAIIVVAAMSLMVSFDDADNINSDPELRINDSYKWITAMGLIASLIMLYVEFLRLFYNRS